MSQRSAAKTSVRASNRATLAAASALVALGGVTGHAALHADEPKPAVTRVYAPPAPLIDLDQIQAPATAELAHRAGWLATALASLLGAAALVSKTARAWMAKSARATGRVAAAGVRAGVRVAAPVLRPLGRVGLWAAGLVAGGVIAAGAVGAFAGELAGVAAGAIAGLVGVGAWRLRRRGDDAPSKTGRARV